MSIRKRMRAKLREIKPQLRRRMHDPVPETARKARGPLRSSPQMMSQLQNQ
jgi:hypothetical protein